MPRPDEDRVRAAAERLGAAHRRVDAELPRDVVRGRDDTTTARVAADDERLPQELLDRCEEGVEVEVARIILRSYGAGRTAQSGPAWGQTPARVARVSRTNVEQPVHRTAQPCKGPWLRCGGSGDTFVTGSPRLCATARVARSASHHRLGCSGSDRGDGCRGAARTPRSRAPGGTRPSAAAVGRPGPRTRARTPGPARRARPASRSPRSGWTPRRRSGRRAAWCGSTARTRSSGTCSTGPSTRTWRPSGAQ